MVEKKAISKANRYSVASGKQDLKDFEHVPQGREEAYEFMGTRVGYPNSDYGNMDRALTFLDNYVRQIPKMGKKYHVGNTRVPALVGIANAIYDKLEGKPYDADDRRFIRNATKFRTRLLRSVKRLEEANSEMKKSPNKTMAEMGVAPQYNINELIGIAKRLEEQIEHRRRKSSSGLERGVTSIIAIAGVLGGIFFLSSNITGNAIANVSQNSSNILGIVLLVVGLVAGFFWIKNK